MTCINPSEINCPICGRELHIPTTQEHHLIPKTFKGRDTIRLHKICHQKLHTVWSEREMEKYYHTIERITEHEEMVKFIKWLKNKAPEFYDKNNDTHQRKGKRK